MLLLPHVPPMNPPDKAEKVVMQSRARKYPYSKGELVTTDGKQPRLRHIILLVFCFCFFFILYGLHLNLCK